MSTGALDNVSVPNESTLVAPPPPDSPGASISHYATLRQPMDTLPSLSVVLIANHADVLLLCWPAARHKQKLAFDEQKQSNTRL